MKKLLCSLFLGILSVVPAQAQNPTIFSGVTNAWSYAFGTNPTIAPLTIDTNNTITGVATYTLRYGYVTASDGNTFVPLAVGSPVIVGSSTSLETVTPTAVNCSTPQVIDTCTFTASFTNAHGVGERVASASAGLQEAALYRFTHGGGLVALSPDWFAHEGGLSAGLTALVTFKSFGTTVTVLNYSGTSGALSYTAAANAVYATTTHIIY